MRRNAWGVITVALLTAGWAATTEAAATATVKAERVNVRGQPSLFGETITQLRKGDAVTILEEVRPAKPKPGAPAAWAKIEMPANTPLWVNTTFVDATNKTVRVPRLNVRAGRGENYSVVGRLTKGTPVNPIRVEDDWMEIETPSNCWAYVDLSLLEKSSDTTPTGPVTAAPPPPVEPKVVPAEPKVTAEAPPPTPAHTPTPPPPKVDAPPALPVVTQPALVPPPAEAKTNAAALAATPSPALAEPPLPPALPVVAPKPVASTPPVTSATPPALPAQPLPTAVVPGSTAAPAVVAPVVPAPLTKRVVRREGRVRATFSIQAPTHFELRGSDTGHLIDYLYPHAPEQNLKSFRGRRVIVTGEEWLDPRWPNTPVIKIDTIELAP